MAEHRIVETSIVRLMKARMVVTHEERGIAVISGPWGIGKTTAINAFIDQVTEHGECPFCAVVKVEPGGKRGVSAIAVMQQTVEALRALRSKRSGKSLHRAYFPLRREVHTELEEIFGEGETSVPFTFIFDEAQYLSREAIEMLRYWNDRDRTTTPFPVGLIFVGNNEFAMGENLGGESVLTGAVRSRLLFEEALSYEHLSDVDLTLFCQSRNVLDPSAISAIIRHFSPSGQHGRRPAPKRDLRVLERLIHTLHRRGEGRAITAAIVEAVFNP